MTHFFWHIQALQPHNKATKFETELVSHLYYGKALAVRVILRICEPVDADFWIINTLDMAVLIC